MLELNKWFFVHLVNFLVLLALLNYILFKPLLALLKKREDGIRDSIETAKSMEKEREKHFEEIGARLHATREQARTIFEERKQAGLTHQKNVLDSAHGEAEEINKKASVSLAAEVESTRKSLRKDVQVFADMIKKKLVGA